MPTGDTTTRSRVGAPSAPPWHWEAYAYALQPSTHTNNEMTDDE